MRLSHQKENLQNDIGRSDPAIEKALGSSPRTSQ